MVAVSRAPRQKSRGWNYWIRDAHPRLCAKFEVMALVTVDSWSSAANRDYRLDLEAGDILYFPKTPFDLPESSLDFLRNLNFSGGSIHKNIAYKTASDRISGVEAGSVEFQPLHSFFREYSHKVTDFVADVLPGYASSWKLDYASYRPVEEEGRDLPVNKRNDLIHTDAFPSRPTNGDLILRVFTNIHPSKSRVWVVSDPFGAIAERYAKDAGLEDLAASAGKLRNGVLRTLKSFGLPVVPRSSYDRFMLRFHEYLKRNGEFQSSASGKYRFEFPPGSTWFAFTDVVPHSVQSGRQALEQTFIIARKSMATPQNAPVAILERLCGKPLLDAA